MNCRRCLSTRLLKLDKKLSQDNDVFRCLECGFLFSPSTPGGASLGASRTVAVRSGYPGGEELDKELGNART